MKTVFCLTAGVASAAEINVLSGGAVEPGLEAFAKASALAETDAIRSRVDRASVSAYKAALEPIWNTDGKALEPDLATKMRPLAKRFFELCHEHGIDRPRESGEDVAGARQRLKKAFGLAEDETF